MSLSAFSVLCMSVCLLSCKLSYGDADYRGISSAMQPRRQRTHYFFLSLPLSLYIPLPLLPSLIKPTLA